MNVTVKLPDDLVREARNLASDEKKSFSSLVGELLRREVDARSKQIEERPSLVEALALPDMPNWFYEKDFPLEDRKSGPVREFSFENDEE